MEVEEAIQTGRREALAMVQVDLLVAQAALVAPEQVGIAMETIAAVYVMARHRFLPMQISRANTQYILEVPTRIGRSCQS